MNNEAMVERTKAWISDYLASCGPLTDEETLYALRALITRAEVMFMAIMKRQDLS